jgi:hypothetical protein
MIQPIQGYECLECGDCFTKENVVMCQHGDCTEYVCPECDGYYCEYCRVIIERSEDGE